MDVWCFSCSDPERRDGKTPGRGQSIEKALPLKRLEGTAPVGSCETNVQTVHSANNFLVQSWFTFGLSFKPQ